MELGSFGKGFMGIARSSVLTIGRLKTQIYHIYFKVLLIGS